MLFTSAMSAFAPLFVQSSRSGTCSGNSLFLTTEGRQTQRTALAGDVFVPSPTTFRARPRDGLTRRAPKLFGSGATAQPCRLCSVVAVPSLLKKLLPEAPAQHRRGLSPTSTNAGAVLAYRLPGDSPLLNASTVHNPGYSSTNPDLSTTSSRRTTRPRSHNGIDPVQCASRSARGPRWSARENAPTPRGRTVVPTSSVRRRIGRAFVAGVKPRSMSMLPSAAKSGVPPDVHRP